MRLMTRFGLLEGSPEEMQEFLEEKPETKRKSPSTFAPKAWEPWEINAIKNLYGKIPIDKLEKKLNKSYQQIVAKANSMGLTMRTKQAYRRKSKTKNKSRPNAHARWTSEEDALLKKHVSKGTASHHIARQFGRTDKSVIARMNKLGLTHR